MWNGKAFQTVSSFEKFDDLIHQEKSSPGNTEIFTLMSADVFYYNHLDKTNARHHTKQREINLY